MHAPGSHRNATTRGPIRLRTSRSTSGKSASTRGGTLGLAPMMRRLPVSATLRMNELVASRTAAGQETIHLGFGEASFPLLPRLREALAAGASSTAYPPVLGFPALRAAVAGYLERTRGLRVAAEQVGIGPGSKPMIYALLQVLEGDVLIPAPSWVSYAPQARLLGKRVIPVPTDPADHLRLTQEALLGAVARARHAGADPRVLVVNTPSNPTGGMFAEEDVVALANWAREQRITIISDEIYAELAHGWRPHISPARLYPEGTIVTGSMSKAFSAGGWRLGYAVVPAGPAGQQVLSAARAVASEIWSGASGPMQVAATAAYSPDPETERYVRRSARLHAFVTGRLRATLVDRGVLCPRPAGGFYLYPDFAPWREVLAARGIGTSMALARHLLDEFGIATLPASEFGEPAEALRLRLATSKLFEPEGAVAAEAREAWLWSLLEAADALGDDPGGAPALGSLHLPALERAIERLRDFIQSLGAVPPE